MLDKITLILRIVISCVCFQAHAVAALRSICVVSGKRLHLSATASGTYPLTYQWFMDGVELKGAVDPEYSLVVGDLPRSFTLAVRISNVAGVTFSDDIVVTSLSQQSSILSGIAGLSARVAAGRGSTPVTMGVIPRNGDSLGLLLRATGPALAKWGVTGLLPDPVLSVYQGSCLVSYNDSWLAEGMKDVMAFLMDRTGAFPLDPRDDKEAALYTVVNGARTVQVSDSKIDGHGVVLVEIYDYGLGTSNRLSNGSLLNFVGSGDESLILGFSIAGIRPVRLLIRGVGPGLASFGISAPLVRPKLELHQNVSGTDKILASNESWGGGRELQTAFNLSGAFLLDPTSADSAFIVTLMPGNYTVLITGADGGTGMALAELYDITQVP